MAYLDKISSNYLTVWFNLFLFLTLSTDHELIMNKFYCYVYTYRENDMIVKISCILYHQDVRGSNFPPYMISIHYLFAPIIIF